MYKFEAFGTVFSFGLGGSMKGIIFNLLEEVTVRHHGEHAWETLLLATGLNGAYTSLGSYPDEDIQGLIAQAAVLLNSTPFDVLRWFGQEAMPLLFERYPQFFRDPISTRSFLLSVNHIIHPEVRKVYPGAQVPTFVFSDGANGTLLMSYRSPRKIGALAQGFAEGAATHYGESLTFQHLECMHRGDERCLCSIAFQTRRAT